MKQKFGQKDLLPRIRDEAGTVFSRKGTRGAEVPPVHPHQWPGAEAGEEGARVRSFPLHALTTRPPSPCWSHSLTFLVCLRPERGSRKWREDLGWSWTSC